MPTVPAYLNVHRLGLERQIELQLDPEQFSQKLMLDYFQGQQVYEAETTAVVDAILQPGDTFIDIGGHVGFFSMLAAGLVGPSGRIYAFEPERRNYEHLLAHIRLNGFSHVYPYPWAVGQHTGIVDFFINLDNDGGHALWDPGHHPFNAKSREQQVCQPVFLTSLDDVFRGASPGFAKLIKIDTEGNEVHVLRGASRFLASAQVPAVIAEVNHFALKERGTSEQEMRAVMTELGYTTYALMRTPPFRLADNESLQTQYVFNLLFVSRQLQAVVASQWPQDARAAGASTGAS